MAYKTQSSDTSEQAERAQIALLRASPVWRKLALLEGLNRSLHTLAVADLRRRFPQASAWDLRCRLAEGALGPERVHALDAAYPSMEGVHVDAQAVAVTLLVTEQLERLDVPYALGGSLASSAQGIFRATNDADLVADLAPAQAEPLAQALQQVFYVDAAAIRDAIRRRSSFNLIHLQTMFKVDVFLPKRRGFDRNQLARRVAEVVQTDPERTLFLTSPEDTVLAKLEWYRAGGGFSDRQWGDILGVLKVQGGSLDRAYLQQWGRTLGVADLLDRALDEAGLADAP